MRFDRHDTRREPGLTAYPYVIILYAHIPWYHPCYTAIDVLYHDCSAGSQWRPVTIEHVERRRQGGTVDRSWLAQRGEGPRVQTVERHR